MNLTEEYRNQNTWRNWESYIIRLPISSQDTIYDFDCSIGVVTKLLSMKASRVVGIDNNTELIEEAERSNYGANISYLTADLTSLDFHDLAICDGIWTSFVVAYFPDFAPILNRWIKFLKPGGWLAIIEINDLFGHEPLSQTTKDIFRSYYLYTRQNNTYDFEMGSRLKEILIYHGFSIHHEENKADKELSFIGRAEPKILQSWNCRFDRMVKFKEFLGVENFYDIKKEFLRCLSNEHHTCTASVKFIVALKN